MMGGWPSALTLVAALGSGLMAGLFFAFSVSVMGGLARVAPASGIAAMNAINVAIQNAIFFLAFFGTALVCLALTIVAILRLPEPGAGYLLAGGLLYLTGVMAVTIMFNVPLNNALATVDPASAEGAALWARYLSTWTAWNHLRVVAPLGSMACFILALRET